MSLKKSILGLFVDIEEDKEPEDQNEPEVSKATPAPAPVPTAMPILSEGKIDSSIAESLAKALEDANIDGYDYFEFAKTLIALASTIPAEQVRYQAAFATASAMGATKQLLLQTAQHYVTVLNDEQEKFGEFVKAQIQENVTSKETAIADIDVAIQEKANQIQELTQHINELSQQKTTIENEVSEAKIKVERVRNDFVTTLKTFLGKIQADMDKISTYIP